MFMGYGRQSTQCKSGVGEPEIFFAPADEVARLAARRSWTAKRAEAPEQLSANKLAVNHPCALAAFR